MTATYPQAVGDRQSPAFRAALYGRDWKCLTMIRCAEKARAVMKAAASEAAFGTLIRLQNQE
jgi:hypothetical protein